MIAQHSNGRNEAHSQFGHAVLTDPEAVEPKVAMPKSLEPFLEHCPRIFERDGRQS